MTVLNLYQNLAGVTFIKRLDPKIVLTHRCQIMRRLMNKTVYTMPTASELVVGQRNAPINSPELCIERRTLTTRSSVLTIELIGR